MCFAKHVQIVNVPIQLVVILVVNVDVARELLSVHRFSYDAVHALSSECARLEDRISLSVDGYTHTANSYCAEGEEGSIRCFKSSPHFAPLGGNAGILQPVAITASARGDDDQITN